MKIKQKTEYTDTYKKLPPENRSGREQNNIIPFNKAQEFKLKINKTIKGK